MCRRRTLRERPDRGLKGGSARLEFLYVEDAVEGLLLGAERFDRSGPSNVTGSMDICIKDLVQLIARLIGCQRWIGRDTTGPNGQLGHRLGTTRVVHQFGFRATAPFEEDLRRAIDWYTVVTVPAPSAAGV